MVGNPGWFVCFVSERDVHVVASSGVCVRDCFFVRRFVGCRVRASCGPAIFYRSLLAPTVMRCSRTRIES